MSPERRPSASASDISFKMAKKKPRRRDPSLRHSDYFPPSECRGESKGLEKKKKNNIYVSRTTQRARFPAKGQRLFISSQTLSLSHQNLQTEIYWSSSCCDLTEACSVARLCCKEHVWGATAIIQSTVISLVSCLMDINKSNTHIVNPTDDCLLWTKATCYQVAKWHHKQGH